MKPRVARPRARRAPGPLAWAAVLATSLLPVAAVAAYMGAPTIPGLEAVFFGLLAAVGLLLVSLAEVVVGLVARRRLVWIDGVLRIVVLGALATPVGKPLLRLVPIGWSFAHSFNPAYACSASRCEDAVVDSISVGGEMLTPRCSIELVRLSDPAGGRAAAIRTLRRSWPSYGPRDPEAYAESASLLSLGRGFYRAVRCEDWD